MKTPDKARRTFETRGYTGFKSIEPVKYERLTFHHKHDNKFRQDLITASDLTREKEVLDMLEQDIGPLAIGEDVTDTVNSTGEDATNSTGEDAIDTVSSSGIDEQIQAAINGESVDDIDDVDADGTLKTKRNKPVPDLPPSKYSHTKLFSGTRKLGKYDECIVAHVKTREPLSIIMRAMGRYTEAEIEAAQSVKEARIKYLVSNGYLLMRADHIKKEIETAVLLLSASVRHDADAASNVRLPLKERQQHMALLKQSIEIMTPIVEIIADRERNPDAHAKPVKGYVDV